jgi:hypothetical protein
VLVSTLATWRGGVGDREVTPLSLAELQPEYRLAIGRLTLDLSHVALNGETVPVEARTRLGVLEVVIPADASVDVTAHVTAGNARVLGRSDGGVGVHEHVVDAAASPSGTLRLDLDMAAGLIRVCRRPTPTLPPAPGCIDVLARTGASA